MRGWSDGGAGVGVLGRRLGCWMGSFGALAVVFGADGSKRAAGSIDRRSSIRGEVESL